MYSLHYPVQSGFIGPLGVALPTTGSMVRGTLHVSRQPGVEVMFDAYSTSLHSIAVLKLEKRMDGQLFYLRDAPHEYSTVPFDFKPVVLPRGSPVPINSLKVHVAVWSPE